jgi:hypothetical protein
MGLDSMLTASGQGARLRAMNEKREGGYPGSDSSSEEEEIEEELGYPTPKFKRLKRKQKRPSL